MDCNSNAGKSRVAECSVGITLGALIGAAVGYEPIFTGIPGLMVSFLVVFLLAVAIGKSAPVRSVLLIALGLSPILWIVQVISFSAGGKMMALNVPLVASLVGVVSVLVGRWRLGISRTDIAIAAWSVAQVVALIFGTATLGLSSIVTRNLAITAYTLAGTFSYFIAKKWGDSSKGYWLVWSIVFAALAAAVFALTSSHTDVAGARRISLGVLNPNQLGQLMVFGIACLLGLNKQVGVAVRPFLPVLMSLFVVVMGLTFSRESFLSLIIVVLLYAGKGTRNRIPAAVLVVIMILGLAFVGTMTVGSADKVRYSEGSARLESLKPGNVLHTITTARIKDQWLPTLYIIYRNWLWGVTPYGLETITTGDVGKFSTPIGNADNMFLGILVTQGTLSFVMFLSLLWAALASIRRIHVATAQRDVGADKAPRTVVSAAYFIFVSYVATGLFAPHFMWPYNPLNMVVFSLVGVVEGLQLRIVGRSRLSRNA